MITACPGCVSERGTATWMIMSVTRQNQQVAAAAIVEDQAWPGELQEELRAAIAPVFAQARSRLTAFAYVAALLAAGGDRRSCWQLAEAAGHGSPRRMQALPGERAWDWKAALKGLQRFILAHLADPGAILVLDLCRSWNYAEAPGA